MIPKKKYRDKVRQRLQIVQKLFADRERTQKLMVKVGGFSEFPSDLHNNLLIVDLFLNQDVPALLDALDKIAQEKRITHEGHESQTI